MNMLHTLLRQLKKTCMGITLNGEDKFSLPMPYKGQKIKHSVIFNQILSIVVICSRCSIGKFKWQKLIKCIP